MTDKYTQLLIEAQKLNVSIDSGIYKPKNEAWSELQISEYELQRRVKEERRFRLEYKLFWIALASSLASVISAAAAFLALDK